VIAGSFLEWTASARELFDIAVGNPPFVRFQFVSDEDKEIAAWLAVTRGRSFRAVSNLWIPVFLGALERLRPSGAFAFIIPSECFTGISAGAVREWLLANTEQLQADLFPPGRFPGVLQQVIILSGIRRAEPARKSARLSFFEHLSNDQTIKWGHDVPMGTETWTRYLLAPEHLEAFCEARQLPAIRQLGQMARLEVSTVTGANDFFSVDQQTVESYELGPWTLPLLPRARFAPGLRFTSEDHEQLVDAGHKALLLYFNGQALVPTKRAGASQYLALGEREGIHKRYKCRVRDPWYRVPLVKPGTLMLSKRTHWYPRLLLNEARVATTDTIYQGSMTAGWQGRERDLVSGFHNSLTLLSAEIEGRSFGGGVLELVPSEVARLSVPAVPGLGAEFERLNELARSAGDPMTLVEETDRLLSKADPSIDHDVLVALREAHDELSKRRFERS
jgi:adenine-specific DNA methylase